MTAPTMASTFCIPLLPFYKSVYTLDMLPIATFFFVQFLYRNWQLKIVQKVEFLSELEAKCYWMNEESNKW